MLFKVKNKIPLEIMDSFGGKSVAILKFYNIEMRERDYKKEHWEPLILNHGRNIKITARLQLKWIYLFQKMNC